MKTIPGFEKFREEAGHDLMKYLDRFEDFSRQSYRGSKYLWITEFEKYLTGSTLEGFRIHLLPRILSANLLGAISSLLITDINN